MLTNIHKNMMGTVDFDMKAGNMRKAQNFIVYPMKNAELRARIQSDKRSGWIMLDSGSVTLFSGEHFNGDFAPVGKLSAECLLMFKAAIFSTASGKAGSNGVVFCDNSGALEVFSA
jgi:hypothetical protein